ncbi:hypothetical protein C8F01DRAFT_385337 [Mycena amicta]|nr:hypothetical protein C8F01DRAFT_385337 [Mycena amicta]
MLTYLHYLSIHLSLHGMPLISSPNVYPNTGLSGFIWTCYLPTYPSVLCACILLFCYLEQGGPLAGRPCINLKRVKSTVAKCFYGMFLVAAIGRPINLPLSFLPLGYPANCPERVRVRRQTP